MKKYVATIMNRLYSKDGNFIYMESHPAIGTVDEKTRIFKDRNGCEYLPMLDSSLMMSEVSDAYYNLTRLDDLCEMVNRDNLTDAISDYAYRCSRLIYYVSRTKDGDCFARAFDMDEERWKIEDALDSYQARHVKNEDYNAREHDMERENDEDKPISEVFNNYDGNKGNNLKEVVDQILLGIVDDKYSLQELRQLRETVNDHLDDYCSLKTSIDLKIEAITGEDTYSDITSLKEEDIVPVEKNTESRIIDFIDIDSLFNKVTSTLIAQDEPVRRVIVEIARKEHSVIGKNRGLLITGSTGVGKTKMMKLIAKYLNRPFFKVDSVQLTVPGFVGKDIEEFLWDLYIQCGRDVKKAEHAIVFFDEIDKKGSSKKSDVSGKGVLNTLLPFIEGTSYDATASVKRQAESVKIDTTNMIVILGGAFEDVYKDLKNNKNIGFGVDVSSNNKSRVATVQDFVDKAQMPDEFMGRVSIVKLNDLTVQDIKRILLESDESALLLQQKLFMELGVKLTPSDQYIEAIAKQAEERGTGARGVNTVVDETTWEAYGDVYSHFGDYEEIILDENTVDDPKQYVKVYSKKSEE